MGTYLKNKLSLLVKQITNTVQTNGRVTIEPLTTCDTVPYGEVQEKRECG